MGKKLILLGMAVAAVAAFAPAVASAELKDASGSVKVGAEITGTSTNAVTTNTKFGTLTCADVQITGEVTENSGSNAKGQGTGGATTSCNSDAGALTVTQPTLKTMSTSGGGTGSLSMTFIADVGSFECHFEGTGGFTYVEGEGNNSINIPGVTLSAAEVCLAEDEETGEPINPTFEGDFALTTEAGGAIWFE